MKKKILIMLPVLVFLALGMAETAKAQMDTVWTKIFPYHHLIVGAAFLPGDSLIVVLSNTNNSTLDTNTNPVLLKALDGSFVREFTGKNNFQFLSMAISPDGTMLAASATNDSADINLQIWNTNTGQLITRLSKGDDSLFLNNREHIVFGLTFTPDGRYLYGVINEYNYDPKPHDDLPGELYVWDTETWEVVKKPRGKIRLSGISPSNKYYAFQYYDINDRIYLADIVTDTIAKEFVADSGSFGSYCFSPDSNYLAVIKVNDNGPLNIIIWNLNTGNIYTSFSLGNQLLYNMIFSSNSKYLVFGSTVEKTSIWDISIPDSVCSILYSTDFIEMSQNLEEILLGGENELRLYNTCSQLSIFENGNQGNKSEIIYPNPTDNKVRFNIENQNPERLTFNLYNGIGSVVKVLKSDNLTSGNNDIEFSTEDLPNGDYFLRVTGKTYNKTFKLIVKK